MRSRAGVKVIALCGLVLGLMAFTGGMARAEVGAHLWTVNAAGQLKDLSVEIMSKKDPIIALTFTTKIAGSSVVFTCTEIEFKGAKSEANGTIGKGAKLRYSGCTTKINGTTSVPCEPLNEGKEKGVILTKGIHILIRLDVLKDGTRHDVEEVIPDEGETLATVEMGAECAVGEKINLIGHVMYKDCQNEFLVHKVEHLLEVLLAEVWVISKTAEHTVTLGGSLIDFLIGEHKGLKWSIEPA
jgi:hypothetical protein